MIMWIGLNDFENIVYGLILYPTSKLYASAQPTNHLRMLYPRVMKVPEILLLFLCIIRWFIYIYMILCIVLNDFENVV